MDIIKNYYKSNAVHDSLIYYVNSSNRLEGDDSDFTYQIQLPPHSEFNYVSVLAASIPKSYYMIESGYNTFILQENQSQVTITLQAGNYNRKTLASVLASLLTSLSPNKWTYSITYPNNALTYDTGLYTFLVTGNTSQPVFIFNQNSPYQQLGFDISSSSQDSAYNFNNGQLIAPNVAKLYIDDNIFIHSDICQNFNDNVLQEIYTGNNTSFSNIVYQNVAPKDYAKKMTTNSSNIYNFYLTNENGEEIFLNGQNIVITLRLYRY